MNSTRVYYMLADTAADLMDLICDVDLTEESEAYRMLTEDILPNLGKRDPMDTFIMLWEVSILTDFLYELV